MPSDIAAGPVAGTPGQEAGYAALGRQIGDIALVHRGGWLWWWIAFAVSVAMTGMLVVSLAWVGYQGVGAWGNNTPVVWAMDIIGYDWWIGVASGALIVSALLLLLGAEWRSALNRIAELVAVIATAAAGLYPIFHLGRPWFFYWNLPYPNSFLLWPQFRSPLVWDAIDIVSFLGVSVVFLYVGLLPDLAALRDRAWTEALRRGVHDDEGRAVLTDRGWMLLRAQVYGVAALGWRGSAVHWARWMRAYRTVALFGAWLVVSLQSGAAVMFAGSVEPGWHDTLLPAAFVLGAAFSGVAVTAVLAVALRGVFGLGALITGRHLSLLALLLLVLALANAYCYAWEFLSAAIGGDRFDAAVMLRRLFGGPSWSFWLIVLLALLPPNLFWLPRMRRAPAALLLVGLLVLAGLWSDRYMIIVVTLEHDFLPAIAHGYTPGFWDWSTFLGTVGLFCTLLLLAVRYLPSVSILEMRRIAGTSRAFVRGSPDAPEARRV